MGLNVSLSQEVYWLDITPQVGMGLTPDVGRVELRDNERCDRSRPQGKGEDVGEGATDGDRGRVRLEGRDDSLYSYLSIECGLT